MQTNQKPPVPVVLSAIATSANDEMFVDSWIASLNSEHSRRNFRMTANCFLPHSTSRDGRGRPRGTQRNHGWPRRLERTSSRVARKEPAVTRLSIWVRPF